MDGLLGNAAMDRVWRASQALVFVRKFRRMDRATDRYRERLKTEDGKVLKDVDEPRSEHRGHGLDKFRKSAWIFFVSYCCASELTCRVQM